MEVETDGQTHRLPVSQSAMGMASALLMGSAAPFGKDVSIQTEGQTVRLLLSPLQSSSVQRLGLYFDAQSYRLTRILVRRNGAQTAIHLEEWKEGIPCTQRGLGE